VAPEALTAVAGLVSDTHLPERLDALPPALFQVMSGVDVVLHAGDIGELRVLDELGRVAPALAVHGNDDTPEAQRELPYQQVLTLAGQRIVLSHTHYPDLEQEMASRREDAWGPKLSRRAGFGHRAGAGIVVWGHTHIPLACWHEGVFLVNPGALASGNYVTRQTRRTVALLFLRRDGRPFVTHVDLHHPEGPYRPRVDLQAGFRAALDAVSESILDPEMATLWESVRERARALDPAARAPLVAALLRAARPCWRGERERLTRADFLAQVQQGESLPPAARDLLAPLAAL
jgi:putative phosphoesterase